MFRCKQTRMKMLFRKQWGCDPRDLPAAHMTRDRMKYIRMYHDHYRKNGIDEITWADLEMDEVFFRINYTKSFVGEQVLYRQLHEPDAADHISVFEKLVSIFSSDEEGRVDYEYILSGIGKRQEDYYLPDMLDIIANHKGTDIRIYRCMQFLLAAAVIGTLMTHSYLWAIGTLILICINLTIYIVKKSKQEVMFSCLRTICVILRFCRHAERNWPLTDESVLDQVREDLAQLKKAERSAGSFSGRKAAAANDPFSLLADYIWGITLTDLVVYERIMQSLVSNEEAVLRLFHFTGMIDAAISCASFRESLDFWCTPVLDREDNITFKRIYHPLLKEAVGNDGTLGKNIIITGANASGKSTFMKAIAVNVILAQTIHTCAASEFAIPAMDVMTSIALRDNILLGESYYVREVRYMKRMLDRLEEKRQVLFVIDEIMKGTNQKESIAVSEAILRYLRNQNCFVIAATHDYELVEKLKEHYDCYYFNCRYEDGMIRFDYLIRPGIGGETNAVRLLRQFDFPDEILFFTEQFLKEGAAL